MDASGGSSSSLLFVEDEDVDDDDDGGGSVGKDVDVDDEEEEVGVVLPGVVDLSGRGGSGTAGTEAEASFGRTWLKNTQGVGLG